MKNNLICGLITMMLLISAGSVQASSTISYNFNSTSIPAGKKIWFSAVVKVNGTPTYPLVINFTNQTISSSAFSLSVADAQLVLDPTVTTATTVFNGGKWVTTAAPNATGYYFISGYCDSLTGSIGGNLHPVSWTGTFSTCKSGISISWQWAAAVYSTFNSNMNNLGVKPSDCNSCSAYSNSDKAGTPEHYKSYVTTGAGGGSGTSGSGGCGGGTSATYVGAYSSIGTVTPAAGSYAQALCKGSTFTETATIPGGIWSSSNTSVATVNGSGIVTGINAGTAKITYTINGCQSWGTVTVNAIPTVSATTTSSLLCNGNTLSLQSTTSSTGGSGGSGGCGGGSGSSSSFSWHGPAGFSSSYQNCSRSGMTPSMAGIYSVTVTSNGCSATATTNAVTVNQMPSSISASVSPNPVCVGNTVHLNATVSGGNGYTLLWRGGTSTINSSTTASATITSATPTDAGVYTLSATAPGCGGTTRSTAALTVNALPSSTGATNSGGTCAGSVTLNAHSSNANRWSWTGSNGFTSTQQNPITTIAGTTTFSLTVSNTTTGCVSSAVYTTIASVGGTADAGTISGAASMCTGTSAAFSKTVSGGSWSSSATSVATISTAGVVTGVSAGIATISYTVTNSCGTATATRDITVNALPDAGTINGGSVACTGTSLTLTNTLSGGAWSTDAPSIATIDASGNVNALSAGVVHIMYTVTNGCGSANTTRSLNVNAAPNPGTIAGGTDLCPGTSATLTNSVSGGVWSSDDATVAEIDAAGMATGVNAGSATIAYTVSNVCGAASATTVINVNALPDAGAITPAAGICVGEVAALNHTVNDGVWITDAAAIASVDALGNVTGVTSGVANVIYTVTNSCGAASTNAMIIVTGLPDAGAIYGTATVCAGTTTIMNDAITGGAWTTGGSGSATIDASGSLTGVTAGDEIISYTVSNSCGSASTTRLVTVITTPDAGSISGSTNVCAGATMTMTNVMPGGAWSSDAASVATVNAAGIVTGVAAGTATISYTVSNICGTANTATVINVNALPDAGTITPTASLCVGAITMLNNTVTGGAWSTSAAAVATVDASGNVTGAGAGMANVMYTVTNECGAASASAAITVTGLPDAGVIGGAATVCAGAMISLYNAVSGGVWSTGGTGSAAINTSGSLTGVTAGNETISYAVTNVCGSSSATKVISVLPQPVAGIIVGNTNVCAGAVTTMTNAATGGVWTSNPTSVATIDAAGVVTGIAAGSATIRYAVSNSCGSVNTTKVINVSLLPVAGPINGVAPICAGTSVALVDTQAGGVWSSGNPGIATVGATGIVTGLAGGNAVISYTLTSGCGAVSATTTVVVSGGLPNAGSLVGPSNVGWDSLILLNNPTGDAGGTWAASNGFVNLAGGLVNGLVPGTVTISYTVTNGCGTATTTKLITVDSPVVHVGVIGGYSFFLCVGGTAAFWNGTTGGIFTMSADDAPVATVTPLGVVTGISAGTATLSYTAWGLTTTSVVTVFPLPAAITGPTSVCQGATLTLTDPSPGGQWTSGIPSTADVNSSGIVSGYNVGVVPIYYTILAPAGCRSTIYVTVNPNPMGITGPESMCSGATVTLADATPGGTWSGSNSHATIDAAGNLTGLSVGGVSITYTGTNTCYRYYVVNVTQGPTAINGNLNACIGTTTFVSDAITPGISWTSSNPTVATISPSGAVTPLTAGTTRITYTLSPGCISTAVVTVNTTPSVSAILGASSVSHSGPGITLSDPTPGGVWTSSNTAILTVGSSTGVVNAMVSAGSANIKYTVTNTAGCSSFATKAISASPAPRSHGGTTTTVGSLISINDEAAAPGAWMSSENGVATVDENGVITAIAEGSADITHTVTDAAGEISTSVTTVVVKAQPMQVSMAPNPNNGRFVVTGTTGTATDATVNIDIMNMAGQVVYTSQIKANSGIINEAVQTNSILPSGAYVLNVRNENETQVVHFVIGN